MDDNSRYYPPEFGWIELVQSCEKCRQPLHIANGQQVPFCPNCAIDNKTAYRGRAMLALAKARDLHARMEAQERQRNTI